MVSILTLSMAATVAPFNAAGPLARLSGQFSQNRRPYPLLAGNSLRQAVSVQYSSSVSSSSASDFQICPNGGGYVHKSVTIDPRAVVEFPAVVHSKAVVGENVLIGSGAVVHSKAVVGENVCIGSGAVVGPRVEVGKETKIGYNVSLSNCTIGEWCIIHNGACIGQDGFVFVERDPDYKITMMSSGLMVNIGDCVEIGANTCIDRGSHKNTAVGDHSKIDNLVHIGHSVWIGKSCMIYSQVGIADSVTVEDYVTMQQRVAVLPDTRIASKVQLDAASCVTSSISLAGDYGGSPAALKELKVPKSGQKRKRH